MTVVERALQRTPEQIETFYRRVMRPVFGPLLRYHDFALRGAEQVPDGALVLSTHAAVTYDLILVLVAFQEQTGRVMHGLADDMWFERAGLRHTIGRLGEGIGSVPASPGVARRLLDAGKIVGVAPGGSRELLRPSTQRHRHCWERRRGFVRLALATGAPVVLCTAPAADRVYDVRPSWLSDAVYRRFRLPLPMVRGVGPTPWPRKVKITHHFSAPIQVPRVRGDPDATLLEQTHRRLCDAMDAHIAACCALEGLTRGR